MSLFAVQTQGARVSVQAESLVALRDKQTLASCPLHEIDEVHLYGDVTLTSAARSELLKRRVDTLFLTSAGTYLGRLVGDLNGNAPRRRAQYRCLIQPENALALARTLVAGKLTNQRALLVRNHREHPECSDPAATAALRQLILRTADAPNLDVLRGIEGHGAAMYFRGLSAAIRRPEFRFERRSRRPPRDAFNACLSFGYTLILRRVESALLRVGLDPYLGALHDPESGKPALALDLMEHFRPLVVDRISLRLVNRWQLSLDDFVNPDVRIEEVASPAEPQSTRPAVYLGAVARPIFLRALNEQWRTRYQYAPRDGSFELNAILQHQASELAAHLEGQRPRFEPFTPR